MTEAERYARIHGPLLKTLLLRKLLDFGRTVRSKQVVRLRDFDSLYVSMCNASAGVKTEFTAGQSMIFNCSIKHLDYYLKSVRVKMLHL